MTSGVLVGVVSLTASLIEAEGKSFQDTVVDRDHKVQTDILSLPSSGPVVVCGSPCTPWHYY